MDTVIPWELVRLNIGNALNLKTGIFTAPLDGVYHFAFSSSNEHFEVNLRLNGVKNGTSFASSRTDSASLCSTFQLRKGDCVDLYLSLGELYDTVRTQNSHFTGLLDVEDLVL